MAPLVVVGLGNPGPRYAGTRHNVGFAVVLRLADRLGARPLERDDAYEAWQGRLPGGGDAPLLLVTPLAFMNRSGEALLRFGGRHELEPGRCLVVVDDVYLPLGTLRLRAAGSAGGHNGLASIERALGTPLFPRLRFGVGTAGDSADLADHVLARFEPEEEPLVVETLERAVEASLVWANEGITAAMNRFNARPRPAGATEPEGER